MAAGEPETMHVDRDHPTTGRRLAATTLGALASTFIWIATADAAPARLALVVGNGAYAALPPTPACARSARAVAEALRGAGYTVVEQLEATGGGFEAAMGDIGRRLVLAPGATAFVYVCSRGVGFSNRAFLLPVSANIERSSDILTQGILAKTVYDGLARGGATTAVVALDIVPPADDPKPAGFDTVALGAAMDGLAALTAVAAAPAEGTTRLSQILTATLVAGTIDNAGLVATAAEKLAGAVAALRPPGTPGQISGAAPADPPPTPMVSVPLKTADPARPAIAMPDDARMTVEDRKLVQAALRPIGYYAGQPDGLFGPETLAAIRRFQHEIGAEMTSRLTAEQATRLVARR